MTAETLPGGYDYVVVGAAGSPHLLQLSGIGPAALLASLGIPVAHDLPGVGENLQDRYATRVVHAVTSPVTCGASTCCGSATARSSRSSRT